jgi:hypothetical protein
MPSWQDFLFVTLCYGKQIEVLHVFFENWYCKLRWLNVSQILKWWFFVFRTKHQVLDKSPFLETVQESTKTRGSAPVEKME